jgi:hypothetical protein
MSMERDTTTPAFSDIIVGSTPANTFVILIEKSPNSVNQPI